MSGFKLISLIGAAALCGLAATGAHAESGKSGKSKPLDVTVRSEAPPIAAQSGAKSLQWDARKGRWGLTFNMDQSDRRAMELNDVQAGAYFRITPSLRVGGAVALGGKSTVAPFSSAQPEQGQPRVRLETAFKF